MRQISIAFLAYTMLPVWGWSQEALHAVWVLNEGYVDVTSGEIVEAVEVGRFDVASGEYTTVATIEGSAFASDLIITTAGAFVAAQGQILHYDLNSGMLLNAVDFEGARKLAYLDGILFATRGDFDQATWESVDFDAYLVWFDAATLTWAGELSVTDGPAYATEGIAVVDDAVYVAINNGFAWGEEVGLIGKYDPATGIYAEFDLGPEGRNPVHLLEQDGMLYTINNGDWTSTSISRFTPWDQATSTVVAASSAAGCNAAAFAGGDLLFQVAGEFSVRSMEPVQLIEQSPWINTAMSFYSIKEDPIGGNVYAAETDWFSYGVVHVFGPDGVEQFSFDCGVSPGVIAMEVREVSGMGEIRPAPNSIQVGTYDASGRKVGGTMRSTGQLTIDILPTGQVIKHMIIR